MTSFPRLSFAGITTNSVHTRTNLVTISNMARPYADGQQDERLAADPAFRRLLDRIIETRLAGKPVLWSMGAHVIKNGMSRYVIELVRHGLLTHVSGNGATSIHDFELALLGETSEDVARSIEDGSFGMWEETGRYMNEAIQQGAARGMGYGASLYHYLMAHTDRFPHDEDCVFVQCQRAGVPYTCHISIGTDIIHQHPIVDFAALGAASGEDFRQLCRSVSGLAEGGVFLNFGSAISGPELFLKGLALARNRGLPMRGITAANFDIVPVDPRAASDRNEPDYHYRPRRVQHDRLAELGGDGHLFRSLHQFSIPTLFHGLLSRKEALGIARFPAAPPTDPQAAAPRRLWPVSERRSRLTLDGAADLDQAAQTTEAVRASKAAGGHATDAEAASKADDPVTSAARNATPHAEADAPSASESYARSSAGWSAPQFGDFIARLVQARKAGAPVLVSLGSHVVGSGVQRELATLIRLGAIQHLALNGAACFQDIELAVCGQAEELEDGYLREGKLGMWRDAGDIIHPALKEGAAHGRGYGESLLALARREPGRFPFLANSLLGACLAEGIPYTCHITVGTDDVQLHPEADFAVQAGASGRDFQAYAYTVSRLEGGVFMNFGSAVTGPEVFLKALSIARNLRHPVHHITTANFDIVRLGDVARKVGYEDWDYYYRPRKNIVHRPVSLGGKGFHFEGRHDETIPAIAAAYAAALS